MGASEMLAMVRDDWFVMGLLALWSVIALGVILERLFALWRLPERSAALYGAVLGAVAKGDLAGAARTCQGSRLAVARMLERGLRGGGAGNSEAAADAMALRRSEVAQELKRNLWLLGTVGSSAPFVGLFGTVMGIVRAFHSMSVAGTGGFKVVAAGISAALIATAAGLIVAIYAVVAYNYFVARVNALGLRYRVYAQELLERVTEVADGHERP